MIVSLLVVIHLSVEFHPVYVSFVPIPMLLGDQINAESILKEIGIWLNEPLHHDEFLLLYFDIYKNLETWGYVYLSFLHTTTSWKL